jgi:starch-binding outer membrane protein SusE/F
MNKLLTYIFLLGLLVFSACEKDETKAVLSSNPTVPTVTLPTSLTFVRADGSDTVEFVGTPVDAGYNAAVTYYLEASASETDFSDSLVLYSGKQDTLIKFQVSDLNALLLKKFTADVASSAYFRIRSVIDAASDITISSNIIAFSVNPYGLPRLDLIGSGITQKVESALGNGSYSGKVKLDTSSPFTLSDPDAGIIYGGSAGILAQNGASITPTVSGWHNLSVNVNNSTYTLDPFRIGLVGSATPNGWNTPDQKMEYDVNTGKWSITITLTDGAMKFRLNDAWGWNLGGTTTNLTHNGADISVSAGKYLITLTITNETTNSEAGTFTMVAVE